MKRRVFLTSAIGFLIGAPLASRWFLSGEPDEAHRFTTDLKKYGKLLSVPVTPVTDVSSTVWIPAPPDSGEWSYVFFCPTFFPKELSRATEEEPDMFLVREGGLCLGNTRNEKKLIGGGDTVSKTCTPIGSEDGPCQTVTLLCEKARFRLAKPQNGAVRPHSDHQFRHLLGLENSKHRELKTGLRWRSGTGRVKPFENFSTDYEVAGFAEIAGRRTVDIAFSGIISSRIPQLAGTRERRGKTPATPAKEALVVNKHRGHAWFDLESGFLVRQETDMECRMSDIEGYRGTDGSNSIDVNTQSILQLFAV